MKITLEPGSSFPPSPLVAANIRAALEAAMVAVDANAPTLQPGGSLTAWFNPATGDVTFYSGVNPVAFKFRHSIVSDTAPDDPVPGMQWFNTNDGAIYTWYASEWVASEVLTALGLTFAVKSDTGQAGGGTRITNIVRITTADYNAIPTPDPETYYWIIDP